MAETGTTLNTDSMRPLYAPWEEPTAHRGRVPRPGVAAPVVARRRPSKKPVVNTLRGLVREWREQGYPGASGTSQILLNYWFDRVHRIQRADGSDFDFRYYFCQREAIETLIYLKEVRRTDRVSRLLDEYGSDAERTAALGISDEEDAWARAAFKMATGSGKTKAMALAIAWSYFHALLETDSSMAKHFVVIAPGLTVYERLKEDFAPGKDKQPAGSIFETDPIIPPEWRGDWNMSVVEQDAAGGAATGGVIYLTNIHRLYDPAKRKNKRKQEMIAAGGPNVSKASALDTGEELRARICAHRNIMVLNDEAHRVWDPESAWNEAISALHEGCLQRGGTGIVHQLDFSATPKDDQGNLFRHVVVDTPLGEAVDGGIVKFPVIGKASELKPSAHKNAGWKYETHLRLGYERWKASQEEWQTDGKKALMFVMCESTQAADEITERLNSDPQVFPMLNGRTINLHTNLKGRIVMRGTGENRQAVFEEKEKEISDEDLKALRKLSRDLDSGDSPYLCIVSVLMLREGWDVKNVTTIVPLRQFSADSGILAEQTLGRGLRRMTGPGTPDGIVEKVTVIDHPKFAELYREELEQEGVFPEITGAEQHEKTTVDIFVDPKKDAASLDIVIPQLSAGHSIRPTVEGLNIQDVRKRFSTLQKLPITSKTDRIIDFEGRALTTGEVVQKLQMDLPTLANNLMALSYYVQLIEDECKITGLYSSIAGEIHTFVQEMLFERKVDLFDPQLTARLGDPDVVTHILHVFVPLVRGRIIQVEMRAPELPPMSLREWKKFKATHSERNPCKPAAKTMFNLVPCRGGLEAAMVPFLDLPENGVAAFAKNAGPRALRIDYVRANGQLSTYTPDFFVRDQNGSMYIVETKGREDTDVPRKARAAVAWCEAASTAAVKWSYVFIPQNASEAMGGGSWADLVRACATALDSLVREEEWREVAPLFAETIAKDVKAALPSFIDQATMDALPDPTRKAVEEAIVLFEFLSKREDSNLAPVFTGLLGQLDLAAKALIEVKLGPKVPGLPQEQRTWFEPYLQGDSAKPRDHYLRMAKNLRKALLYDAPLMPIGLLRDCLDYALNDAARFGGVFEAIRHQFRFDGSRKVLENVTARYEFRNKYVAHPEVELTSATPASTELGKWVTTLSELWHLAESP